MRRSHVSSHRRSRRQRTAATSLAVLFLTTTHLPGLVALAVPQYFTRLGAGVANLPVNVLSFASPGFGDVADAVNLASGNVYLDLGPINRNNVTAPGDDPSFTGGLHATGIKRLAGYQPQLTTLPAEWAMALGDGAYQYFRRATATEFNAAPSWVAQRYAGLGSSVATYITKPQTSTQVSEEWLVLVPTSAGGWVAHHYDHQGTRTTFRNDGEYADFVMTPHEQYASASTKSDPDGLTATAKTEFTYTAPGNGHLASVRDAWGRFSTYEWNDAAGYMTKANLLQQGDGTFAQTITYNYELRINNQYAVNRVTYETFDGRGGRMSRTFKMAYLEQNGKTLLQSITRPVASAGNPDIGPTRSTTFAYDTSNRIKQITEPGLGTTKLAYTNDSVAGGNALRVTRTDGAKRTTVHFTSAGWVHLVEIQGTEWDVRRGTTTIFTLKNQYTQYNATGQLTKRVNNGQETRFEYDVHGNQVREQVFDGTGTAAVLVREILTPHNADNRVISQETRPVRLSDSGLDGDARYSYNPVVETSTYTHFPAVAPAGQVFTALQTVSTTLDEQLNGTWQTTVTDFDRWGRRVKTSVTPKDLSTTQTVWTYHSDSGLIDDLAPVVRDNHYSPYQSGGIVGSPTIRARIYGDQAVLVSEGTSAQPNLRVTQTIQNPLGIPILIHQIGAVTSDWTSGTPTTSDVTTYLSFNGFGQKVLEQQVLLTPNVIWKTERLSQWIYHASGELDAEWTGTSANVTDYEYSTSGTNVGWLTKIRKGAGYETYVNQAELSTETVLSYDTYGRVAKSIVNDFPTTYQYDVADRLTSQTNPDGSEKTLYYTPNDQIARESFKEVDGVTSTTLFTYDSLGRLTLKTFPNGATQKTTYDPFDRPIKITDNRLAMNAASDRSIYLQYDSRGNLTKQLGPALLTGSGGPYVDGRRPFEQWTYDALNRKTQHDQQLTGNVTPAGMALDPAGRVATDRVIAYDAFGRPTHTTDAEDYATFNTYDLVGNLTKTVRQVFKGGESHRYDETGAAATAPVSEVKYYAFNSSQKVTKETSGRGYSSETVYDLYGNVVYTKNKRGIVEKGYTYTGDGRLVSTYVPKITSTAPSFDPGNPTAYHDVLETRVYGTAKPQPTAVHRALMDGFAVTSYLYDSNGNVITETLPNNGIIRKTYRNDGQTIQETSAEGFVTQHQYDVSGNLTSSTLNARPNTIDAEAFPGVSSLVDTYKYDLMGNKTESSQKGLTTLYTYNTLGKAVWESRPFTSAKTVRPTPADPTKKIRTYRLDGQVIAETGYDYSGSFATNAGSALDWSTAAGITVNTGSATLNNHDRKGQLISSQLIGKWTSPEHTVYYLVDGMGQTYARSFEGVVGIYPRQRTPSGNGLDFPHYLTYWVYDLDGNLKAKWDRPSTSAWSAITDTTRRNLFTYSYNANNKEIEQQREVQQTSVTTSSLLPRVQNAYSWSVVNTTYTSRDDISTVSYRENTPVGSTAKHELSRTVTYTYYKDGRRSLTTIQNVA